MTPEQIAYWDKVFAAMVKTEEWKKDLDANFWDDAYANAKGASKRLDENTVAIIKARPEVKTAVPRLNLAFPAAVFVSGGVQWGTWPCRATLPPRCLIRRTPSRG